MSVAGDGSIPTAAEDLANDALRQQLGVVQARVRAVMLEFNIPSGQLRAMAHSAERAISDTGLRAAFLRLLIDLHVFGREAKRRSLLRPSVPRSRPQPVFGDARPVRGRPNSSDGRRLDAAQDDGSDAVTEDVSRAFFARLDGPNEPRVPTFPNRGQS